MQLILPNHILNDTPADATQVDQNYAVIQQFINEWLINKDGNVTMEAQLHLVGDPVNDNDAVRKHYVDALMPIGVMLPYGGQAAPAGKWALCNGASLQTAAFPELHKVIGYRYGGSGGTFLLPKMDMRFPIGMDTRTTGARTDMNATGKVGGGFPAVVALHNHPMPHSHEHPHTHPIPHTHTINHDHGAFNTGAETTTHDHAISTRQNSTPGTTGSLMNASATGTTIAASTGPESPTHIHQANVPAYSGPSGPVSTPNTGAVSEATTGGASTPNTSNAGVASVEQIPPFIVFTYIIRTD